MNPKEQVVRSFIRLLEGFIPLKEARIATLGGKGLEAQIWRELGVLPENGWLIERNHERRGKLIRTYRYRIQNHLGTFHQTLAGLGKVHIDAMHLDLCGTITRNVAADLKSILPLILGSKGRCLAITVADSRRNLALEEWPRVEKRALKLFGARRLKLLYNQLLEIQKRVPTKQYALPFSTPSDPAKATKREIGLMVELADLLKDLGQNSLTTLARHIYVSRYQKRPFRMRTYFFRFQKNREDPSSFAETWANSHLFFANGDEFEEVIVPVGQPDNLQKQGESMMKSKLGELVKVLGGAEEAEYNDLLAKSQQFETIAAAINQMSMPATEKPAAPMATTALVETPKVEIRRNKRNFAELSDRERIEWQLSTLETKTRTNGHWDNGKWEELLLKDFGYYNEDLGRSCRSALARTSGKFRANFKERIRTVFGEEARQYLDRLAKLQ